ncbi:MAG TPA: S8 family serine peptidase [Labilithrix sp.]|nr:S8 family serine peptidase [Labilithrix sp.]
MAAAIVIGLSASCSADDRALGERRAGEPARSSNVPARGAIVQPEIADVSSLDRDANRVDDVLDMETRAIRDQLAASADPSLRAAARARLEERVGIEAVFDRAITQADLDTFTQAGGVVRHVFRAVSFGFTGTLPRSAIEPAAHALGANFLLFEAHRRIERHLDEATRKSRIRPVWASGFAGTSGFSGTPTINIAILDTGVDATHPDLAGRMVGWKDYTTDAAPSPIDVDGHGSHVAGIAVGSGAAFGVGPATLHYTDSGDISMFASGGWDQNPAHLPKALNITSTATWVGGGSSTLTVMRRGNGYTTGPFTSLSSTSAGASPLTLSFAGATATVPSIGVALTQNASRQISRYSIVNDIADYPAAGDAFPAMRGVAAGSGWFGAKVFPTTGPATTEDIGMAMDDMIVLRESLNIKVINASFGIGAGESDPVLRAKTNTLVANGIVVVASVGNGGRDATIGDPARAARVIAVGAVNDLNQLTEYTSAGLPNMGNDVDLKPDVLAPGGSAYASKILSVDSNSADAKSASFADARADDYTHEMGTSMAAPFVTGTAALLIQALEQSGMPWQFDSSASPLLVKMLLLASATETNRPRESFMGNPTLGRNVLPKDRFEGYGVLNPDAAIEAATLTYDGAPFSDSTTGESFARRAWGRKMTIPLGQTLKLALETAASADFDLYVYAGADAKGNPSLVASSTLGLGKAEELAWTATWTAPVQLFVKYVDGAGEFTLTGATFTCGDGTLEPGEQCEPTIAGNAACCSSTCQYAPPSNPCDDGDACTHVDHCNGSGECVSSPLVCSPPGECQIAACKPGTGCVSSPMDDGTPCNGGTCFAGTCVRPDAGVLPVDRGTRATVQSGSMDAGSDDSTDLPSGPRAGGSGCACALAPSTDARASRRRSEVALTMLALTFAVRRRRATRR